MRRRTLLSAGFGAAYYAAILIGDSASAGSTWREGMGHALIFGTFFFVVSFPLILLIQAGVVRLLRGLWFRFSKDASKTRVPPPPKGIVTAPGAPRRISTVPIWEFVPLAVLTGLFLSAASGSSQEDEFRRFVSRDRPQSVRSFNCWYMSGHGTRSWVVSFRIAPADFPRVITRYPYVQSANPDGFELSVLKDVRESRDDFPVEYPSEPMVLCYRHSMPGPGGGLHVSIYANAEKSLVYVIGSFN